MRQKRLKTTALDQSKPVVCFLEVHKTCVNVFGILPRFLESFLESENLNCSVSVTSMKKTALVSPSFGSIILLHLFSGHCAHTFYGG